MPDKRYQQQLNTARARERMARLKTHGVKGRTAAFVLGEVAERVTEKMLKALDDREKWIWPVMLALAIAADFSDVIGIGTIPIIGMFLDILVWLILYMFTNSLQATGPLLGLRIKLLWWLFGLAEVASSWIPFIGGVVPAWTIGVIWTRHKVNKRAELAKEGFEKLKKGEIKTELLKQFS